ncbi:MAG: hypothetical protein J6Q51_03035 [Clostridia bacterium]|nr:hypothetical protein [Clostridia bacterium]
MKDGIICGMVLGMIAGALLYKHNPQAKEIINKTEEVVMDISNPNQASKKSN